MSQKIALEAHSTFGPLTASAVLQVCPSSAVLQVCPSSAGPQVCPSSAVLQVCPSSAGPQVCPSSAVLQVCPSSASPQVCPSSAGPQVRPSSAVVAEPSSALKFLRLYNPRSWSKDDYSRFAVVAVVLLELLRQIS